MKLHLVPASQGMQWVRAGMQTFWQQPLALSGLFFLFLTLLSLCSLLPWLGSVLALVLLPGATLGLMAATQQAAQGRFPMPHVMFSAFRAGRWQVRAMLLLGCLYAVGFLLVLGVSALCDGGTFASLYLGRTTLTPELLQANDVQWAMLVAATLYLPVSLMFWHAPALVHWHDVAPIKSLFFSLLACVRNFLAFTVYGVVWAVVFMLVALALTTVAAMLGGAEAVLAILYPMGLLLAAMFFTSIFFTFIDCFELTPGDKP